MPSPDRHFANAAIFTQSTGVTPNSGDAALYIKTDNKLYVKNSSGTEAQVTADMVGATSSVAGTAGLVPAPAAGDQEFFLRGDATFVEGTIPQRSIPSGRFLSEIWGGSAGATAFNGGRTHFSLIHITKRTTFDRIGFVQNTAGLTHNVRIGMYNCSLTTGLPTTVLFDAGEITLNGAGTYTATISQTINAGLYYGALYTGSANINTVRYSTNIVLGIIRGVDAGGTSFPSGGYPYLQSVPTNSATAFPDNPTITGTTGMQSPAIFLRAA